MENTTFTTEPFQSEESQMATKKAPAKKAAPAKGARPRQVIVHTDAELALIGHKVPELLTATDPRQRMALYERGQKALKPARRRPHNSLYMACVYQPKYVEGTLKKMREALKKFPPPPLPLPKKGGGVEGSKVIRWKDHEATLIAYDDEVFPLIHDLERDPTNTKLLEATLHAQARQLDRTRWRVRESLQQSMYNRHHLKHLRAMLARPKPEGLKPMHEHSIVEPTVTPEDIAQAETAAVEARTIPEPPAAAVAHPLADALAVIAQALGPAITRMLSHVTTQVVRSVIAELKEPAPKPADAPTTEQISAAVRSTVIEILGAPAAPPEPVAVVPEPPSAPVPIFVPAKRNLERIDVVGLLSVQQQAVRKRCGDMFDLRFISADAVGNADLGATTVVCTKFVSHDAQERAKAKGSRVLYANGGAQSVVKRLRELAVSQ